MPRKRPHKFVVAITAAVVLAFVVSVDCGADSEPAAPPKNAKELFEACVSGWDGNHDGLEERIQAKLNDPEA